MSVRSRVPFPKDPLFFSGLALFILWVVVAAAGPVLAPYDPWDMQFDPLSPPSGAHLLGANDGGQDILSELLYATRNSLAFGCITGLCALALGVIIGGACAWFGGWFDLIVMRVADVLLSIPMVMILILVSALFRPSPAVLALLLAGFTWPTIGRAIRAQGMTLRERLHIRAARQMGGGYVYILRRHFIPELFPLFVIGFAAKARMAVFMEASLAFLGLFDPSHKSLGLMINLALKYYYMDIWWNWLAPPIVCLCLMVMGVTFLAVGMERMYDPRLRDFIGVGTG